MILELSHYTYKFVTKYFIKFNNFLFLTYPVALHFQAINLEPKLQLYFLLFLKKIPIKAWILEREHKQILHQNFFLKIKGAISKKFK